MVMQMTQRIPNLSVKGIIQSMPPKKAADSLS